MAEPANREEPKSVVARLELVLSYLVQKHLIGLQFGIMLMITEVENGNVTQSDNGLPKYVQQM